MRGLCHGRRGISIVEVLIVAGILVLLFSIILAAVPMVRRTAQSSASRQMLAVIQAGIDQYYNDHRAYPGPLSDATILTGVDVPAGITSAPTMSENLVLGLLGGLAPGAAGGGAVRYQESLIGRGPLFLGYNSPAPPKVYVDMTAAKPMLSPAGRPFQDVGGIRARDSIVPEFVDRFEEPLPILYLRARNGAPGIMSDEAIQTANGGRILQYDIRQVTPYTTSDIGLKPGKAHGLRQLGPDPIADGLDPRSPNTALRYFREPGSPTGNITGAPRQRNRYILIGAGPDRLYGTRDDITSFGDLMP